MTTFIKPLVFEQSNIQAQQFIPSFFLPPLTHDIDTLRTLISLIKSPPLLPCLQLLCIKLALTTDFKQYFPVLVKNATNKMQNLTFNLKLLTNNMKNWLVSDKNQWVSQRIPKVQKNNEKYFIKNHWKIWPSYSHLRNSIYCSSHYQYNKVTEAVDRRSKRNLKIFLLEKLKTKWLLSLLVIHILIITLRPKSKPSLINLIKVSNNDNKKRQSSRGKNVSNKKSLVMNWFLSNQKHCAPRTLYKC